MQQPNWWQQEIQAVAQSLNSDASKGLGRQEAAKRLREQGPNRIPRPAQTSVWRIIAAQFSSLIIWVLIAAALIAAALGEWIDCGAIAAITLLNALLGSFQEWRSVRAMEALTRFAIPTTTVIREGRHHTCSVEEVVPGDLVLLQAGDSIPADGRVVTSYQLSTQEAALTGESTSINKTTDPIDQPYLTPSDQRNMVFRGTTVANGKAMVLVTATGLNTEIGKIARLLEEIEVEPTPLQNQLEVLGRRLVYLCLAIAALIVLVGYLEGYALYRLMLIGMSLAVAAVPEGLPAVVTIALAIGMGRMAKRQALIRRLAAVETLGSTTVICSDKTGTLTENKMRVQSIWVDGHLIEMTGQGYAPTGEFLLEGNPIDAQQVLTLPELLKVAFYCNSASVEQKDEQWEITGDPTEAALIVAAKLAQAEGRVTLEAQNIRGELPFDSTRKMMSVVLDNQLLVKGAPDVVLSRSTCLQQNGDTVQLSDEIREQLLGTLDDLASSGLRVLALATRTIDPSSKIDPSMEEQLTFLGFAALRDPPRPQAKAAIETCRQAGIRPVMITGDHKATAISIAKELGLLETGTVLQGVDVEHLSDEQLDQTIGSVSVFSRVTAEHKMRIVDSLQRQGEVVAMTGDGVNDAPALDTADIGIAMGITGTDVTKSVSDMVILDDRFDSIVAAVEQGRAVFDNIVKFTSYLLSCNLAEVLIVFLGMFFLASGGSDGHSVILEPIHLLWINLITDGFPAVALAMDPVSPNVMRRNPRDPRAPLIGRRWMWRLGTLSLIICAITVAVFLGCLPLGTSQATSAAFTLIVLLELLKPFLIRIPYHVEGLSNRILIVAVLLSLGLQLAVLYVPALQGLLQTVPIGYAEWQWIIGGLAAFTLMAYPILRNAPCDS